MIVTVAALLFVAVAIIYAGYMENKRPAIDPTTYQPLLQLIAKAESNGNYNAYFGNSRNSEIKFTDMTIAEVLKWQADFVAKGNPSSAVGKYQIINTTLSGLIRQLGIDQNQKFDSAMQDRLAIALIERRGAEEYVSKELTREQFAHNLSKEWAGLPKVIGDKPQDSYYAGDGLNRSRVAVNDVLRAVATISPQQ